MDLQLHQDVRPGGFRVGRGRVPFRRPGEIAGRVHRRDGHAGDPGGRETPARGVRVPALRQLAGADGKALPGAAQVQPVARMQRGFPGPSSEPIHQGIPGPGEEPARALCAPPGDLERIRQRHAQRRQQNLGGQGDGRRGAGRRAAHEQQALDQQQERWDRLSTETSRGMEGEP